MLPSGASGLISSSPAMTATSLRDPLGALDPPTSVVGAPVAPAGDALLLTVDELRARQLPRRFLQRHWIIPVRGTPGSTLIAAAGPLAEGVTTEILDRTGVEPQVVRVPDRDVREALGDFFEVEDAAVITSMVPVPLSARHVLGARHFVAGIIALALLCASLAANLEATATALVTISLGLYAVGTAYKLYLLTLSLWTPRHIQMPDGVPLADEALPKYTVLIPLYREGPLLPRLIAALAATDYPKEKLEVFLLLEADDVETRVAAGAIELPPYMYTLVVPGGHPKGKPRALDYGLLYARGDLLVIYDAEDVPDPSQLRAAATAFAQEGENVACVQCSLAFYNGRQNMLTRLFAVEYATWFEFVLPALSATSVPIPLGGTSNHFRLDVLRRLGGWDAYNVTEDADLGMRLARAGYRTVTVDSTTLEEANSRVWNWVRQRTRWNKGHAVTYLVHMRRPVQLWRELGTAGFLSWQLLVGGGLLTQLLNPVFWTLLVVWYATQWEAMRPLFSTPLLYVGNVLLFGSTFAYITFGAFACLRNRHYYAAPAALLLPVYWLMQSFAAYRALVQLVTSPHYWEKTDHNLATASAIRKSGLLAIEVRDAGNSGRPDARVSASAP